MLYAFILIKSVSHGINPARLISFKTRLTHAHIIQINSRRKIEHKTLENKLKSCVNSQTPYYALTDLGTSKVLEISLYFFKIKYKFWLLPP